MAETVCVIDIFDGANQGLPDASERAKQITATGKLNEMGHFVIRCDECEADFAINDGEGLPASLLLLEAPQKPEEACADANGTFKGGIATYLNPSWFEVDLLKDSKPLDMPLETGEVYTYELELDADGLEKVIDDTANKIVGSKKLRETARRGHTSSAFGDVARAWSDDVEVVIGVLDKIVPMQDGESWRQIIHNRADALEGEPPAGQDQVSE